MIKTAALFALLLLPQFGYCDQISRFKYECEHVDAVREGVTCALRKDEVRGGILMLKIHTTATSPKEKRERTSYVIDTLTHNFLVIGGTAIFKRVRNRSGVEVERFCSKIKGEMEVYCGEWYSPLPEDKNKWAWSNDR